MIYQKTKKIRKINYTMEQITIYKSKNIQFFSEEKNQDLWFDFKSIEEFLQIPCLEKKMIESKLFKIPQDICVKEFLSVSKVFVTLESLLCFFRFQREKSNEIKSLVKTVLEEKQKTINSKVDNNQKDLSSSILKNNEENPIGCLQELVVSRGWKIPEYEVVKETGPDHKKEFELCCIVGNTKRYGSASSKKQAKKLAASNMINYIVNLISTSKDN